MVPTMTETTTTTTLPLAPGLWTLDPLHSQVTFAIRHIGISKVRGAFKAFDATLDVGDTLGETYITAVIDVSSLDTGNADRDAHVLTPEFLHAEAHPELRFVSTGITGSGEDWVLEGEATIYGITKPFAFDVEFGGVAEAMGQRKAGFSASGQLSRKDYGVDFGPAANLMLGDVVKFELDLQFVEPSSD